VEREGPEPDETSIKSVNAAICKHLDPEKMVLVKAGFFCAKNRAT